MSLALGAASAAHAQCADDEFCTDAGGPDISGGGSVDNPCWDKEAERDICNEPPAPCPPEGDASFQFIDDRDGTNDGQLVSMDQAGQEIACGTLLVDKTGYYKLFDLELSESCQKQLDETGYLTVVNSCNPEGWASEANAGQRYLVLDSDNTPACAGDGDCGAGMVCRPGTNQGSCCVPASPTFMGTFLLVAGEPNILCLHHWCPEWRAASEQGGDPGFVTAGCQGINSIHFLVGSQAVICEEDTMLNPCSWGCQDGQCLPDPCEAAGCPAYCKDGVCLAENPCAALSCPHGCKNGRCLQPPSAPGEDADGDGYPFAADCDDGRADVHPGRIEICGNGIDDNCDGFIDEPGCQMGTSGGDGGSASSGAAPVEVGGGCGCSLSGGSPLAALLLLLTLLGALRLARRG